MKQAPPPGRFITVEGSEGAGKSTNIDFIRSELVARGIPVVETREPGGTPLGEEIRKLLLGHRHDGMADNTELMLIFAARYEHISQVIRPALARGEWVLCDRFTDASYAYQGGGRGIPMERIAQLEEWVQQGLEPDLTMLLDIPVDEGLERTRNRSEGPDRFEQQQLDFFERVRLCYLERANRYPRFALVDARQSLAQVQEQIRDILSRFIQQVGFSD